MGHKYALRLLRCSSAPRCKQRPRVISPSVFCRRKAAAKSSSLLRGSRGGSAAEHRFSFAVKIRHRRYHWSRIQPLSLLLPRSGNKIQLPLHRGAEKCAQFALQRTGSREMRFIWLITPILRIIIHNALFSDLSLWDAHILRKGSERVAKILQKLGL